MEKNEPTTVADGKESSFFHLEPTVKKPEPQCFFFRLEQTKATPSPEDSNDKVRTFAFFRMKPTEIKKYCFFLQGRGEICFCSLGADNKKA